MCVLLGLGHETLGSVWVLRGLTGENLPRIPFGGPAMSAATIHATWHIVTVFALSVGALLIMLSLDVADPKTLLLRVFAVMWLTIAGVAIWAGARRVRRFRDLFRLPVPVFFIVVAVLCWVAST